MKRLICLIKKDVILGIKDIFIILEVAASISIMVAILLLVPKDINRDVPIYIYDSSDLFHNYLKMMPENINEESSQIFLDSRGEVVKKMKENKNSVGLLLSKNDRNTYKTDMLIQPFTPPSMIKFVEVNINDVLAIITPPHGTYPPDVYESVRIRALQNGTRDTIPFNKQILPAIIMIMVGILGLFAMVSLLGQERTDETIRAFRVSPADMWSFITSKHLMLLGTSIITFSILYCPIIGFQGYLPALLITLLTVFVGSSLGVVLAGFFDTPMSAIGWVFLIMIIFGLPSVSLFAPIFSPDWLKFIPTYYTLFGLDAAMFSDGNTHIIRQSITILAGTGIILFALSGFLFNRKIRREG